MAPARPRAGVGLCWEPAGTGAGVWPHHCKTLKTPLGGQHVALTPAVQLHRTQCHRGSAWGDPQGTAGFGPLRGLERGCGPGPSCATQPLVGSPWWVPGAPCGECLGLPRAPRAPAPLAGVAGSLPALLMSLIKAIAAGRGPQCCPPGTAAAPSMGQGTPPSPWGSLPIAIWGSRGAQLPLACSTFPLLPQPPSPTPCPLPALMASCCRRSWFSSTNPLILCPAGGAGSWAVSSTGDAARSWGGGPCCATCPGHGGLGACWRVTCWMGALGAPRGVTHQVGGWSRALPAQEFPVINETKAETSALLCCSRHPLPDLICLGRLGGLQGPGAAAVRGWGTGPPIHPDPVPSHSELRGLRGAVWDRGAPCWGAGGRGTCAAAGGRQGACCPPPGCHRSARPCPCPPAEQALPPGNAAHLPPPHPLTPCWLHPHTPLSRRSYPGLMLLPGGGRGIG